MFSSNHTLFFLLTLVLHITGILFISNQTKRQKDITMARLEISAVELNLTDAAEDSQPSPPPPPKPEPKKLEPEPKPTPPVPTPVPEPPEPKPEPIPIVEKEMEPVILPKKEPTPKPEPQEKEPEIVPEPPKPKVETQPEKPPPKIVETVAELKEPPPKTNLKPPPEMPESETPESGAASARINMPPKPRRKIKPRYPTGARRRGEEGSVTLNVRISASGRAVDVEITQSSGFPELDQAAKHAIQKARFAPGTIDDWAVESQAGLTIIFKLR